MDTHSPEFRFATGRQNCDKALHTLGGILRGMTFDGVVNRAEQDELRRWISTHEKQRHQHPLIDGAITAVARILEDNEVTPEEVEELVELCAYVSGSVAFYDDATHVMQRLHGLIHGILADREINDTEVKALEDWLNDNFGVREYWPVSEIETLIVKAVQDGAISAEERAELIEVLDYFTQRSAPNGNSGRLRTVKGICATAPELVFPGTTFCITGISDKASRRDMVKHIESRGGMWRNSVSGETKYLIVCADGNASWAYASYGRKVEQAMRLREEGAALVIVHERDFWDVIVP